MSSSDWAYTQLSQLLPLDPASLTQILEYTSTLSKETAAEHLKNLLGDSPKALEFITSYNFRRHATTATDSGVVISTVNDAPEDVPRRRAPKKKAPLHQLPARRVEDHGATANAYQKGNGGDYMSSTKRGGEPALSSSLALSDTPEARQLPTKGSSKAPPSAAGQLISDLPNVRTKSQTSSRTASPAPAKMKVNVPGGVAGHGASTTLEDLVCLEHPLLLVVCPHHVFLGGD